MPDLLCARRDSPTMSFPNTLAGHTIRIYLNGSTAYSNTHIRVYGIGFWGMELKNPRRRCSFFALRRDLWDDRLHSVEIKTVSVKGSPPGLKRRAFPGWRINEMGFERKQRRKLCELGLSHTMGSI
jgi:hypothetical protein